MALWKQRVFVLGREWPAPWGRCTNLPGLSLQRGPSLVPWGHSDTLISLFRLTGYSAHVDLQGSAQHFKLVFLTLYTHGPSLPHSHAFTLSLALRNIQFVLWKQHIDWIYFESYICSFRYCHLLLCLLPLPCHWFKGQISDEFYTPLSVQETPFLLNEIESTLPMLVPSSSEVESRCHIHDWRQEMYLSYRSLGA